MKLRSKQKINNEVDNKFTLKFSKIKLRFKDDKRRQSLMEQNHMRMEQLLEKHAKKKCWNMLKQINIKK